MPSIQKFECQLIEEMSEKLQKLLNFKSLNRTFSPGAKNFPFCQLQKVNTIGSSKRLSFTINKHASVLSTH